MEPTKCSTNYTIFDRYFSIYTIWNYMFVSILSIFIDNIICFHFKIVFTCIIFHVLLKTNLILTQKKT